MNSLSRKPPTNVPVLTEILSDDLDVSDHEWASPPSDVTIMATTTALDEGALIDAVWARLDNALSDVLEARIRERLAPITARLADSLVAEVQIALDAEIKVLLSQAIKQELDQRTQGLA